MGFLTDDHVAAIQNLDPGSESTIFYIAIYLHLEICIAASLAFSRIFPTQLRGQLLPCPSGNLGEQLNVHPIQRSPESWIFRASAARICDCDQSYSRESISRHTIPCICPSFKYVEEGSSLGRFEITVQGWEENKKSSDEGVNEADREPSHHVKKKSRSLFIAALPFMEGRRYHSRFEYVEAPGS